MALRVPCPEHHEGLMQFPTTLVTPQDRGRVVLCGQCSLSSVRCPFLPSPLTILSSTPAQPLRPLPAPSRFLPCLLFVVKPPVPCVPWSLWQPADTFS